VRVLIPVLLIVLCLEGRAAGEKQMPGPPPASPLTVPEAAAVVLDAVRAGDGAGLRRLATRDAPDPWLVADALWARGEQEVAEAFAAAVGLFSTEPSSSRCRRAP